MLVSKGATREGNIIFDIGDWTNWRCVRILVTLPFLSLNMQMTQIGSAGSVTVDDREAIFFYFLLSM